MFAAASNASLAVAVVLAIVALLVGLVIGRRRGAVASSSTNYRLMAMENRLLEAEQKLNKIAVEIQHLPTADTVHGMALKIAEVGGDVKALQGSVLATNRLVERIDQYLIAKGT